MEANSFIIVEIPDLQHERDSFHLVCINAKLRFKAVINKNSSIRPKPGYVFYKVDYSTAQAEELFFLGISYQSQLQQPL